jgi:hypothetical protein
MQRACVLLFLLVACSKTKGDGSDGGAVDVAAAPPVAVVEAGPGPVSAAKPAAGAVARSTVARLEDDPALAAQTATLVPHFGAGAKGPFAVQRIAISAMGAPVREATLVTRENGASPIVLVTEGAKLLWTKVQPVAGMTPPVEHVTIAPHDALGVALFGWNPANGVVVGRVWADDSNAFGDFEILHLTSCNDVVAGYVPGEGIWIAAETAGGPMLQLLDENNVLQRGRTGLLVGAAPRAAAPLSLAIAGGAVFLGWWAAPATPTGDDRFVVGRFVKGKLTGALAETVIARGTLDRMPLAAEGDGVRLGLPRGAKGSKAIAIAIDATGAVRPLER